MLDLARALPPLSWRDGTKGRLSSRFARVRAANDDLAREEEWLVIEWPRGELEPRHCWLLTLPEPTSFRTLVFNVMGRWMIERNYEELKSELGLHYEGRNWRGFHHHATLCIAAYGFLILERLLNKKSNGLARDRAESESRQLTSSQSRRMSGAWRRLSGVPSKTICPWPIT